MRFVKKDRIQSSAKGISRTMSLVLNLDSNRLRAGRPWTPAVDILETADTVSLKADLADVKVEDIDIRMENNTLTLTGKRHLDSDSNIKGWHRIERSYGEFKRSFEVPSTVDTGKVAADYRNGVLTISLPKKETAKPRQIKVEIQQAA